MNLKDDNRIEISDNIISSIPVSVIEQEDFKIKMKIEKGKEDQKQEAEAEEFKNQIKKLTSSSKQLELHGTTTVTLNFKMYCGLIKTIIENYLDAVRERDCNHNEKCCKKEEIEITYDSKKFKLEGFFTLIDGIRNPGSAASAK